MSDLGKDLLTQLLVKDPKKRLSAQEALGHEWFAHCKKIKGGTEDPLDDEMLANLKEYKGSSKLK